MSKILKSGRFVGSAKGMHDHVKVELKIESGKIVDAQVLTSTASPFYAKISKLLAQEIISKQSSDIDAVSGASVTSRSVQDAAYAALKKAGGGAPTDLKLKDGVYTASASGHGAPLTVEVTTKADRIADVKVVHAMETPYVGDDAMKRIPREMVQQQTLNVDAITGATMTSQAVINAVHQALAKAGNPRAWAQRPFVKKVVPAEDMKADVVIAGAGISGLSTAAFAVKRGLKVILLEKNDQIGGSFRYSAGAFATHGSKAVAAAHQENDLTELLDWVKKANQDHPKRPIDMAFVKYLIENSGETFDGLLEMGNTAPTFFVKFPYVGAGFGSGGEAAQILEKYIETHGGKILRGTVITKIDLEAGQIVGVSAKNASGSFTITAKNVVIATGGASHGKKSLLEKTTPSLKQVHVFNEANPGNTGDGYEVLKAVGASFYGNDVYKSAELDFDPSLYITFHNEPSYNQAFVINDQGKRFTNEAPFSFLNLTTALYNEGSPRYYLIYDGEQIDAALKEKLDQLPQTPKIGAHAMRIQELAAKIQIDPTTLQKTFDDYQTACDTGKDRFGKSSENLKKFSGKSGYYAVYVMPGTWGTIGGVKINRNMQVEKEDGTYFDHLFAVGEMSTGALFTDYYMLGFSLAYYSTEGRLVAAQLSPL